MICPLQHPLPIQETELERCRRIWWRRNEVQVTGTIKEKEVEVGFQLFVGAVT